MASSLPSDCLKCEGSFSLLNPSLSLPCGHALCKTCTSELKLKNNIKCPMCKNVWTEDLIEASVTLVATTEESNNTLTIDEEQQQEFISDSEEEKPPKKINLQQVLCTDHEEEVPFYCATCVELLCTECVSSKHKSHDFCTLKKGGQKVKVAISKALDEAMAKSKLEKNLINDCIAKAGQKKDLLQHFESDVVHEKNLQKNIKKKLDLHHEVISSRFPLFNEVTNLLETIHQEVSPPLIKELQERVKYVPEELVGASEEENPIPAMAKAYMVS